MATGKRRMTVGPFLDRKREWRWGARRNGRVILTSGESFAHKGNAQRACDNALDLIRSGDFERVDAL